jgi:pseudouridine synthase
MKIRLNKFLSRSGVASRREADRLIEEGRVKVNGQVVMTLGFKVDITIDDVDVDGKRIDKESPLVYLMVNKPTGCVVSLKDPFHQKTVMDFLPSLDERIFPVGRLDKDSEGLLLLTNDGELAHRLMHPRYEIKKEYLVETKGCLDPARIKSLEKGISLDGKKTAPAKIRLLSSGPKKSLLSIEIHEGRKREIRRMLAAVGQTVCSLKRVRYAGLTLAGLDPGCWRYLSQRELNRLKKLVSLDDTRAS